MTNRIPDSELVLAGDGTMYHLRLRPENISPIVITVGDPARVMEVSRHFDAVEFRTANREFVTHGGRIGTTALTVLSTGIGTGNIDIVLSELDALVNIDLDTRRVKQNHTSLQIIRLGTCGSLQASLSLGSQVLSLYGLGLDNLLHYYRYTNTEDETNLLQSFQSDSGFIGPAPYAFSCSPRLEKAFRPSIHRGITLTCPGFYGPQGRTLRSLPVFPGMPDILSRFSFQGISPANMDMETAGLYGMTRVLGHECISVGTVVANRVTGEFSKDSESVVQHLIRAVLETIAGL